MSRKRRAVVSSIGLFASCLASLFASCLLLVAEPELSAIPDQAAALGTELVLQLEPYASDPAGRSLVFSVTEGPGAIDRDSGVYRFTPSRPGSYSVEIAVSNGLKEVRRSFTIAAS
jgi:hypothetical protein